MSILSLDRFQRGSGSEYLRTNGQRYYLLTFKIVAVPQLTQLWRHNWCSWAATIVNNLLTEQGIYKLHRLLIISFTGFSEGRRDRRGTAIERSQSASFVSRTRTRIQSQKSAGKRRTNECVSSPSGTDRKEYAGDLRRFKLRVRKLTQKYCPKAKFTPVNGAMK